MTTETEPQDFAAFEATVTSGEPDTPVADEPNPEVNDEAKPLELTEDDELVEDGEEDGEDKGDKRRHKPAKQRIAEQRWQIGERDRKIAELEARLAGGSTATAPATLAELQAKRPDPNDEKYEFGSASEEYQEDLTDWKVEVKLAERDAKANEEAARSDALETFQNLNQQWDAHAVKGAEKYEDFDEAIQNYQTEVPEVPLLLTAAIQGSEVGADIAYHFGKNPADAKLITAELLTGTQDSVLSACRRFGEIGGQFLDKEPAMPGRGAGPLDMAHYAGQLKAWTAKAAKPAELRVTNAPVPPRHGVRGAGGKFQKDPSEMNYAEFEAHVKRAG